MKLASVRPRACLTLAILAVLSVVGFTLWAQELDEPSQPVQEKLKPTERNLAGTVEGVVTFQGEIPKSAIPDNAGVRRELLEVDTKTRGLRYVVAYLALSDRSVPQPPETSPPVLLGGPQVTVDQEAEAFKPRVLAVRAGQPIAFSNSDQGNHNVRATSPIAKNVFNVVTGRDGKYEHRFVADPELRPIRLDCDIHPWMRGWIYVFDRPYFSVSDGQGRFRIGSVPSGRYKLMAHQPDIRYTAERDVTVTEGLATRIEIEVRAGDPEKSNE